MHSHIRRWVFAHVCACVRHTDFLLRMCNSTAVHAEEAMKEDNDF